MYDLQEKRILIVGASSGIGEETALLLSKAGAKVILVARRTELLNNICERIGDDKACYYSADVSNIDAIGPLIKQIIKEQNKLDGMVYSAGIVDDVPIKYLDNKRLLKTFNTNFFGFVEFVRQVCDKNNYNKGMRIVAVSSVAAIKGEKAHSGYAASKAAMEATVRCLAKELWGKGIALNTVQPSMVRTQVFFDYVNTIEKDIIEDIVKHSQYAGIGETIDVANAIAFLLSPESRFITGISLPVDGGCSTT